MYFILSSLPLLLHTIPALLLSFHSFFLFTTSRRDFARVSTGAFDHTAAVAEVELSSRLSELVREKPPIAELPSLSKQNNWAS